MIGAANEAHVYVEPDGKHYVRSLVRGDTAGQVMQIFGHDPAELQGSVASILEGRVRDGTLDERLLADALRRVDAREPALVGAHALTEGLAWEQAHVRAHRRQARVEALIKPGANR